MKFWRFALLILFSLLAISFFAGCRYPINNNDSSVDGGSPSEQKNGGSSSEQKIRYTLKFETDGGTEISSITLLSGEVASIPQTTPAKRGYPFEGWYLDSTCTVISPVAFQITKDITLYAKWGDEFPHFYVVFEDGSYRAGILDRYPNESIDDPSLHSYLSTPPGRTGKRVWCTDATLKTEVIWPFTPTKQYTYLYAKWK